jgi:cyclase
MQQITENVFAQAEWRGANTSFVVTSEGIVLIDVPPDAANALEWAVEIAKKGKVRFVIDTEAHHDHWITNSLFGGVVVAHQAARDVMVMMDHKFIRSRTDLLYTEPIDFPDSVPIRLPEVTFSQNMTIRLGKHTFQLIHTPGHMEGQIAVYVPEERILFTGDTVLNRIRTPFHDAITDDRWLNSMKVLEDLDVRYIIPGHGDLPVEKAWLKTQRAIVEGFFKAMQEGKTKGVSVPVDVHRSFDPFYETQPRGVHPEGVVLAPTKESVETGKHGDLQ